MGMITGACFCKAVQYELLTESQMQGLCYCTDCQVVGGSSHWASYAVAPSDFRLLEGTLTPYTYYRGTQIMVQSDELGVASVTAMTFDDAKQFKPQIAYFSGSAPPWCEVDPCLTAFGDAE